MQTYYYSINDCLHSVCIAHTKIAIYTTGSCIHHYKVQVNLSVYEREGLTTTRIENKKIPLNDSTCNQIDECGYFQRKKKPSIVYSYSLEFLLFQQQFVAGWLTYWTADLVSRVHLKGAAG